MTRRVTSGVLEYCSSQCWPGESRRPSSLVDLSENISTLCGLGSIVE